MHSLFSLREAIDLKRYITSNIQCEENLQSSSTCLTDPESVQLYTFFIFSDTYRPVRYCSLNSCDLCIYSIWPFFWLMKLVWLRPWLNTPYKPTLQVGVVAYQIHQSDCHLFSHAFSRMKIITFWNIFHERLYLPFKLAISNHCYCWRQAITLLNDTQFTDVYLYIFTYTGVNELTGLTRKASPPNLQTLQYLDARLGRYMCVLSMNKLLNKQSICWWFETNHQQLDYLFNSLFRLMIKETYQSSAFLWCSVQNVISTRQRVNQKSGINPSIVCPRVSVP